MKRKTTIVLSGGGLPTNIGVITWAFSSIVGETILTNFINILEPLSNDLFVITGTFHENVIFNKKTHIKNIKHIIKKESTVIKIIRYILMQLRISINLIKISKNIDIVIFFLGTNLLLPMIFTKLLKKKTILVATHSASKMAEKMYSKKLLCYGGLIFSCIARFLEKNVYTLSDQIVVDINVESESLIRQFGLTKYKHKISFGGALPVDLNSFNINKKLKNRKNIIGYIGRHSPEKGVMNFAKAIPLILKERNDLEFIIGSGGSLFEKIKDELKENGSYDKVIFTGWVPREKLPDYFNEMKLIVVPSYTETIPNVILEAMACGTPIVAAPAVAIPDFIRDGENGFLMENNSPECIAKNVIRALDDPRLDEIVKSAHDLINREYTYDAVVENYRKLLMKNG